MKENNLKELQDTGMELAVDFWELCEKYKKRLSPAEFGCVIIGVTVQMLYDSAPNGQLVKELVDMALKEAYESFGKKGVKDES